MGTGTPWHRAGTHLTRDNKCVKPGAVTGVWSTLPYRRPTSVVTAVSPPAQVSPPRALAGAGFWAQRTALQRSPPGPNRRTPAPAPRTGLLPAACPPAPPRRALPPPPGTEAPVPPRVTAWYPPGSTPLSPAATQLRLCSGSASAAHAHALPGQGFWRACAMKRTVPRRLQHSDESRMWEAGQALGAGLERPLQAQRA